MLEEKIVSLRRELIEYAILVEDMIDKSIHGLQKKDQKLLTGVIEKEEPKANDYEILIDELCTTTIAKFEPKAKDLRTILMILKMNNDLERIADHAVNIAESGLFLIERPSVKPLIDIPRMAEVSVNMLKDSVNGYINEDTALARSVCERDSIVDGLAEQILRELITIMSIDRTTIFMVEGRVIKHHQDSE